MFPSHAPADYRCPFCALVTGPGNGVNAPADIVARNDRALAFISPTWWPRNHGHVLVVPTTHYENLYTLPDVDGHAIFDLVREIAVAIRATYGCDGTSTRQHNEPSGNQDVWHYHMHVFPRFAGDELYRTPPEPGFVSGAQRLVYADRLRAYFAQSVPEQRPPGSGAEPAFGR